MKVKISEIMDGMDLQSEETHTVLNIKTGEYFNYHESMIGAVDEELTEDDDFYKEEVQKVKEYLNNKADYINLPTELDIKEGKIMESFIVTIADELQRVKLFQAIQGKGAFERFRDLVLRFSLLDKWFEFRGEAISDNVKKWCERNNLEFED